MNLHRADKLPDWELVAPEERNHWQIRAADTKGWDTPGNRETAKGLGASLAGLWLLDKEMYIAGSALLLYGRYKDLKDGRVADQTGTKSPLGEALDATVDKILMGVALPILVKKGLISKEQAAAMALEHGMASAANLASEKLGKRAHPSVAGKWSGAVEWASFGLLTVSKAARSKIFEKYPTIATAGEIMQAAGEAGIKIGIALGGVAAAGYAKDLVETVEERKMFTAPSEASINTTE